MSEAWETSDNRTHQRLGEPNVAMKAKDIDMKWIQLPEAIGGTRAKVLKKTSQPCRCKKHITAVYALEGDILCYYCETSKGFAFVYK
jgi:hypothetical protein